MIVKIGKLPGALVELVVEEGSTVRNVLELANLSVEAVTGYDLRIKNSLANLDTVLHDGDYAIFAKRCQSSK